MLPVTTGSVEKVEGKIKMGHGGRRPGSGRKPGVPNKLTGEVKDMIAAALDAVGDQEYLERCAESYPPAFLALVAKLLPPPIKADAAEPLVVKVVRGF